MSAALRYAAGNLHPSKYQNFHVIASSGSIVELYRQIGQELGIAKSSISKAVMTSAIRKEIMGYQHKAGHFFTILVLCQFHNQAKTKGLLTG